MACGVRLRSRGVVAKIVFVACVLPALFVIVFDFLFLFFRRAVLFDRTCRVASSPPVTGVVLLFVCFRTPKNVYRCQPASGLRRLSRCVDVTSAVQPVAVKPASCAE